MGVFIMHETNQIRRMIWLAFISCVMYCAVDAGVFPTVCVDNVTDSGVCCPIPPDGNLPCGFPSKGECLPMPLESNGSPDLKRPLYDDLKGDDRFHWPIQFLTHSCECKGNYYGHDCSKCKFGYKGENCDERKENVVRKNIEFMTSEEKSKFIDAVNKIKFIDSGWSAMTVNRDVGLDAMVTPKSRIFHPVTKYDLHVYRHMYSARTSLLDDGTCFKTGDNGQLADWAHFGPGFAPWHRLWLLLVERDLQEVSGDPQMAIPYWDWSDGGSICPTSICNPEFMGEVAANDEVMNSPIKDWTTVCDPPADEPCDFCDPSRTGKQIKRNPGSNPAVRITPDIKQVEYLMNLTQYDIYPYNDRDTNSFSSILDSTLVSVPGYTGPTLHAQVHVFMNGTMSDGFASTPNDPVFLLHHGQVDRLYEAWLDKYRPDIQTFPGWDARPGHAAEDPLVPYFPVEKVVEYFHLGDHFGYKYDNIDVIPRLTIQNLQAPKPTEGSNANYTTVTVLVCFMLVVITCGAVWSYKSFCKTSKQFSYSPL